MDLEQEFSLKRRRLYRSMSHDPTLRTPFSTLVDEGCDGSRLLVNVALCIYPRPGLKRDQLSSRAKYQGYARDAVKLAKQMTRLAEQIRKVQKSKVFSFGIRLDTLLEKHADAVLFKVKPPLMAASRLFLNDDLPLLRLCAYVKNSTGRLHYREIGALLTGGYGAAGRTKVVHPDTVSKRIRRFRDRAGKDLFSVFYPQKTRTKKKKS